MTRLFQPIGANVVAFAIVAVVVVVFGFVAPRGFVVPVRADQPPTVEGQVVRVLGTRTDSSTGSGNVIRDLQVAVGDRLVAVEDARTPGAVLLQMPQPGDDVLLQSTPGSDGAPRFYIVDHTRSGLLLAIGALFVTLVLFVGRGYGLRALLGLGVTYIVLMRFVLPGILSGHSPLTVSLAGGIGIMASTLVLAHGADRKSGAAVGGTALALVTIVVLSQIAITAAKFNGLGEETAVTVFTLFGGAIDARGLLLAGILIGALGALDDVTMTQSSTVFELHDANPAFSARELYARGMRVGRDHIASIVNTLVLAYAGAALPLLVILASQSEGVGILVNREFLATEVVRTLAGSIGLVAAVPLTTAFAAGMAARRHVAPPASTLPRAATELDAADLRQAPRGRV